MTSLAFWLALMIGQGDCLPNEVCGLNRQYVDPGKPHTEVKCPVGKDCKLYFTDSAGRVIFTFPDDWDKMASYPVQDFHFTKNCGGISGPCPKPEPMDVPAIQETIPNEKAVLCFQAIGACWAKGEDGEMLAPEDWLNANAATRAKIHLYRHTCEQKTRGLWHDEQTPAKYYCRKPQVEDGK